MVQLIEGLPPHVAAFRATGKITENDYLDIINPQVEKVYREFGKINYLMIIETPLTNYSVGAWLKDAALGFIYYTDWRKIAIVSYQQKVKSFTDLFGILVPGTSRGFMMEDLEKAEKWISQ